MAMAGPYPTANRQRSTPHRLTDLEWTLCTKEACLLQHVLFVVVLPNQTSILGGGGGGGGYSFISAAGGLGSPQGVGGLLLFDVMKSCSGTWRHLLRHCARHPQHIEP